MATVPVLEVHLDVIQQEIEYQGIVKTLPESYWKDPLTPLLYPLWDSDKDKLITFNWFNNGTYNARRRKYIMNFTTNTFEWKDYEMEQVAAADATTFKGQLVDAFYAIDAVENQEFQNELASMYSKTRSISPMSVRLARDFLLTDTDWVFVEDSQVSAADKDLYKKYRTKLRDITASTEFSTNVEDTKFPISPDFYNKIYKVENPSNAYLDTDDQFLKLGLHYLKAFREKIAHYLLSKSFTENSFFDILLTEYNRVKQDMIAAQPGANSGIGEISAADKEEYLDKLLARVQADVEAAKSS